MDGKPPWARVGKEGPLPHGVVRLLYMELIRIRFVGLDWNCARWLDLCIIADYYFVSRHHDWIGVWYQQS